MKKIYSLLFTGLTIISLYFTPTLVFCQDSSELIPPPDGALEPLPHGPLLTFFLPRTINIIFALQYTVVVVVLIYAGVLYIRNDEVDKAKRIFIYAIIGFLIATVSYAFVEGVISLKFFN